MSLPPQFTGAPASVGARLVALSIDVAIVAVLVAATGLISGSLPLAAAVATQSILALWILQARLGVGPGSAILGLRVSRADAPFSPGAGRSFVRGSFTAMGALVLAAGAWAVEATAGRDRSGLRRSWADRAAQTVVVVVPRRDRTTADVAAPLRSGAERAALLEPTVVARPWAAAAVAPSASRGPAEARSEEPVADPALAPRWGDQPQHPPVAVPPAVAADTYSAVRTDGAVPLEPDDGMTVVTGELLLIFDTGQREQLPVPVQVNLGRTPSQSEASDRLVTVRDPDGSVSKTHLRLEHDRTGLWVTDAGSTNGSELIDDDGTTDPLTPGVRTPLDDSTRVRIGNRVFTVSRLIGDLS
jgi:hypothetical protein